MGGWTTDRSTDGASSRCTWRSGTGSPACGKKVYGRREGDHRDPMASRPRMRGAPAPTPPAGAARQEITLASRTPPGRPRVRQPTPFSDIPSDASQARIPDQPLAAQSLPSEDQLIPRDHRSPPPPDLLPPPGPEDDHVKARDHCLLQHSVAPHHRRSQSCATLCPTPLA